MNRVVRLGDVLVRLRRLAIVLLLPCLLSGQQTKPQDQGVPDAPTPQQPDSLGNLTTGVAPGKGTPQDTPDEGTNTTQAPPATGNQSTGPDQVQGKPPEVPESGQMQKDLATFRTNINYVIVPVTVLDKKHQQVAGLTWRDFQIFENNQRQRIAFFGDDAVALSVALVIDQSLPRDTMKKVNDSLAAIQGGFTPADEIAVFTYADGVTNPTDFTAALARGSRLCWRSRKKKATTWVCPPIAAPLRRPFHQRPVGGPKSRSAAGKLRGGSYPQGNPYPERCDPGGRKGSFHPP